MTEERYLLVAVAGVTHVDGYPDNLLRLLEVDEARGVSGEGIAAVLLREPDNPADPDAIRVDVPAIGPIGYVPRDVAAILAHALDAGARFVVEVVRVRVHPEATHRPGITIALRPPSKELRP